VGQTTCIDGFRGEFLWEPEVATRLLGIVRPQSTGLLYTVRDFGARSIFIMFLKQLWAEAVGAASSGGIASKALFDR
jgi:hypothetical protein